MAFVRPALHNDMTFLYVLCHLMFDRGNRQFAYTSHYPYFSHRLDQLAAKHLYVHTRFDSLLGIIVSSPA